MILLQHLIGSFVASLKPKIMRYVKTFFLLFCAGALLVSCESDDAEDMPQTLNAGTLSGGPFAFTVDGTPDRVSGIALSDFNGSGDAQTYVITDDQNNILGLPPTLEAVEGVDFDEAGPGVCLIWHMTYRTGLTGLQVGNNVSELAGDYDLSNAITVNRNTLESTRFTVTIENVGTPRMYFDSGTIGFIMPGQSASYTFHAGSGHYLSLATMFVQSNDLFFAPEEAGLALYDAMGNAVTGDVTSSILLWDAGTEVNEEPGVGPNQAPRQAGPDTGVDEGGTVQRLSNVNDGFTYPAVADQLQVILEHDGGTEFTLTLNNISDMSGIASPLAPGVWVVHSGNQTPVFMEGMPASPGLEDIAEDGDNSISDMELSENSGFVTPFAPGAFAVNEMVFQTGAPSTAAFEDLAEDGDPSGYTDIFNTPVGASAPGPIFPGQSYSFTCEAVDGDVLSLATMLIQSNDWVIGGNGLALFENGMPVTGDITAQLAIYDSGTEVDEYPGAGPNQAPRQTGPDTGVDENGMVMLEGAIPANVPQVSEMLRVTLSVEN